MKYKVSGDIVDKKDSLYTMQEILDAIKVMECDSCIYMYANSYNGRIVIHRNADGTYELEVQHSACYFLKPIELEDIEGRLQNPLDLIRTPEKYGFKWYE